LEIYIYAIASAQADAVNPLEDPLLPKRWLKSKDKQLVGQGLARRQSMAA
jgi:hypothetical protein